MTEIKFSNHKRVIQTQEILGHGPSYEDQLLGSRVLHDEKEFPQRSARLAIYIYWFRNFCWERKRCRDYVNCTRTYVGKLTKCSGTRVSLGRCSARNILALEMSKKIIFTPDSEFLRYSHMVVDRLILVVFHFRWRLSFSKFHRPSGECATKSMYLKWVTCSVLVKWSCGVSWIQHVPSDIYFYLKKIDLEIGILYLYLIRVEHFIPGILNLDVILIFRQLKRNPGLFLKSRPFALEQHASRGVVFQNMLHRYIRNWKLE